MRKENRVTKVETATRNTEARQVRSVAEANPCGVPAKQGRKVFAKAGPATSLASGQLGVVSYVISI